MGHVCEWLGLKEWAHQGGAGSGKSLSISEGRGKKGADRKDEVGEISLGSHSLTEVGYHWAEEDTFTMCKDVAQEFICYGHQWFCQFLSLKKIMEMAYTKFFLHFFGVLCSYFWISCLEVHVFVGSFILEHNVSIPEVTPWHCPTAGV